MEEKRGAGHFEWPVFDERVLPDLRIDPTVRDAREAARQARTRASEGRRAAAQAKRRAGLQGAFGIKAERATIVDDTEIAATRGLSQGAKLGTVRYATGATMTGAFGPDLGVYTGASDSPLLLFSGWVWGAASGSPRPIDGIFEWKNGDVFTGSIDGSGSRSNGIYVKAGGQIRFVGIVDFSASDFHPVEGVVENSSGKLLAVVREN